MLNEISLPQSVQGADEQLRKRLREIKLVIFDFDGVFTNNMVFVFEDGREAVQCSRFDGIGLSKIAACGVTAIILSKEVNPVVSARAKKLRLRCIQQCDDKKTAVNELMIEMGLKTNQVAFVGNDINDIPALEIVGLPIIVKDAHPDVIRYAAYRTTVRGGEGAVREVCDWIDQAHD